MKELEDGCRVGNYWVVRLLGKGGMGGLNADKTRRITCEKSLMAIWLAIAVFLRVGGGVPQGALNLLAGTDAKVANC